MIRHLFLNIQFSDDQYDVEQLLELIDEPDSGISKMKTDSTLINEEDSNVVVDNNTGSSLPTLTEPEHGEIARDLSETKNKDTKQKAKRRKFC